MTDIEGERERKRRGERTKGMSEKRKANVLILLSGFFFLTVKTKLPFCRFVRVHCMPRIQTFTRTRTHTHEYGALHANVLYDDDDELFAGMLIGSGRHYMFWCVVLLCMFAARIHADGQRIINICMVFHFGIHKQNHVHGCWWIAH